MERHEARFVEFRGEHGTLADALNEIKRTAQDEKSVQFTTIRIFLGSENPRLYVSRMEGKVVR